MQDKYINHPRNNNKNENRNRNKRAWRETVKEKFSDFATYFGVLYYLLGMILSSDARQKFIKTIRKAMGKESLSITLKGHTYDKRYPKFEKQLKEEKFTDYIGFDGHKSKYLKISENGKWICFCDEYYPMDLIYGRPNDNETHIYTIEGGSIYLCSRIPDIARRELYEFFERKGNIVDIYITEAHEIYWSLDYHGRFVVEKANWAGLRLAWEEAAAQRKHPRAKGKNYIVVLKGGRINPDLYYRVLSNSEIAKVISALKQKTISPGDVFTYDIYVNEYTVCNAIRIAEEVRNIYKTETLDFLFMCLNDIDEAYFHRAARLIIKYPHSMIKERLEEQALIAYNNQDALHLAGLLYIAKEIDYEIGCLKNMEEAVTTQSL